MSVIRILPEKVSIQIAAGEVIERPASVVRELIDNSIDAGAKRISVAIRDGGKSLVRVADDGSGMARDDLLLCVERHATSKISAITDLFCIKTLGFRGEALPSISAVSRTDILSRRPEELIGHMLKIAGGKIKALEETGAPAGTTVEIRDLFFNTPARKKFLRASATETDHIMDTVARIALPFVSIHFRLDADEKTLLSLPASQEDINRLSALFGRDAAGSMTENALEKGNFRIRSYVASPDMSRSRGDRIFIYVNKRNVRDRVLTHAVMEGYGQRLMKGRYPQAVLFIDMDPSLVDVNVHPTKQEVHFREAREVHDTLVSVVNEALGGRPHLGFGTARGPGGAVEESGSSGYALAEPAGGYAWDQPAGGMVDVEAGHPAGRENQAAELFGERIEIIGQLKNTYILCQTEDGFLMVDQHAAHERVVYEDLKKSAGKGGTEVQPFLIPPHLEFPPKEARIVSRHSDQLGKLGIEIEPFGGTTFLIRSVPAVMVHANWMEFLKELSPVLEKNADLSREEVLDGLLTVMACHGAIRAGKHLSFDEMRYLISQLNAAQLPNHCPHGRPVFKKFSFYEIEKMFKRVT
jgi:DNA mismatch repair protein MutL